MTERSTPEDFVLVSVPGLFEDHEYTWVHSLSPVRPPDTFNGTLEFHAVVRTEEYIEDVINSFRNTDGKTNHLSVMHQLAVDFPRGNRILNNDPCLSSSTMLAEVVKFVWPSRAAALLTQASLAIPLVMLMQMFTPLFVGEIDRSRTNAPIQTWHLISTAADGSKLLVPEVHITKWLRCFYLDHTGEAVTTHFVRIYSVIPINSETQPFASVRLEIHNELPEEMEQRVKKKPQQPMGGK